MASLQNGSLTWIFDTALPLLANSNHNLFSRSSEEGVRYESRQGVTYLLYNAMISGCALYDQAVEALALYQRIKEEDLKRDNLYQCVIT
ncbi:unnamed protein product [Malus baccata var. baccata]